MSTGDFNNTIAQPMEDDEWEWEFAPETKVFIALVYVLCAVSIIGLPPCVFILWASRILYKTSKEIVHVFVASLTSAVLILNIALQIREIDLFHFVTDFHLIRNIVIMSFLTLIKVCFPAFKFSLLMLNLNHIISTYWSQRYNSIFTYKRVVVGIIGCWFVCIMHAVLVMAFVSCEFGHCYFPNHHYISEILYILFVMLPLICSAILNVSFWVMRLKNQGVNAMTCWSINTAFITTTTGVIVFTCLPFGLYRVAVGFEDSLYSVYYDYPAYFIFRVSIILQPLVTLLLQPSYKKLMIKRFRRRSQNEIASTFELVSQA